MKSCSPHLNNGQWWHTSDYHSPKLNKTSLGLFLYEVLKEGAYIGEVWPFNIKYNTSPVIFTVYMTEEMKINIESRTKFKFSKPSTIKLN